LFSDPYIEALQKFGWNVVRLPRTGLEPLQLLYRYKDDLTKLGELASVITNNGSSPLPSKKQSNAAQIEKERTSELKIGIGLSILASIVSLFGGNGDQLKTKYGGSASLSFGYDNVTQEEISIADLDVYLKNSDVNASSGYMDQLLDMDEVYIITAVLKSNKINVSAKDSKGLDVKLSLPEIKGVIGANVAVSRKSELSSEISYEGTNTLVFGFQVIQLIYDKGSYISFKPPERDFAFRSVGQNLIFSNPGSFTDIKL